MNASDGQPATGQEVLVVDGDRNVLHGLERLLGDAGLTVTSFTDPGRVRDQVEKRFIPVVLCDLDTPHQGAGVDLVRFVRARSPLTSVVVMTPRKGFEAVAAAFRAGAVDVVPKTNDSVLYLRDRVVAAAVEVRSVISREQLLDETLEVHETFLKKMMELTRHAIDLEDKLLSRDGDAASSARQLEVLSVLLVDDEAALNEALSRELPAEGGWRIRHAQSGGEALDAASQAPPNVVVVNERLPDLPARMVVKTIKGSVPDAVTLVFTPPSDGSPGEVKMVESSRLLTLIPAFRAPDQMVASLNEVREALRQKHKERRYLTAFRKQQFEFLKRFNQLRQRLEQARAGQRSSTAV